MLEKELNKNEIIEEVVKILMENGNLFFENYQGEIFPITYCDVNKEKIIFKE